MYIIIQLQHYYSYKMYVTRYMYNFYIIIKKKFTKQRVE